MCDNKNLNLDKVYSHKETEEEIYKLWESNNLFAPIKKNINKNNKKYTIVMPPPNITGNLHMGHALDNTIQDIITRYKRMSGYSMLWVPGTDHASIATEAKIIEKLREQNLTKEELGRDEFLKLAWEWKEKYGSNIKKQLKKLGVSCDWSRERFTLDSGCSKAVKEFFVNLYKKKLIYRGEKIINWCPKCLTSISDSEVNFEEKPGNFYYIKYKLNNSIDNINNYVVVATTRPETIFGDVALAVNPDDERYKNLIGQEVIVPIINRKIPIIGDSYVDVELGTGVLKITPAHDFNDFEVGLRHNLPVINVFDEKACIINKNIGEIDEKYIGLDRYQARKEIVKDLKNYNFILKIEELKHNVGTCYRCSTVIEPRISTQWFVKMDSLAKKSIESVRNNNIKFVPSRFSKIFYHWMENIKDWCISRQLWWGHRIPVWYCKNCGEIIVSTEDNIKNCTKCSSEDLVMEQDTLDTWFSSGLWPFSSLGWPDNTEDLSEYFPTNVLVTGYDIIFFWVAKMIFSSLEIMEKPPFEHVLIHGLVRDSQGRKMSKSLGNGIDPLEIIDKYGADALRFSIILGTSPGNDLRFYDEKVESCRNFANKIWNAARFIITKLNSCENINKLNLNNFEEFYNNCDNIDKWIISRLNKVAQEVINDLEKFELGLAAQKLYDFVWDEFCDWYIEFSKLCDRNYVLLYVLENILKLLHPFMPFVTEKIWRNFNNNYIITSEFPEYNLKYINSNSEQEIEILMCLIKSIRNLRRELNINNNKKITVYLEYNNLKINKILELYNKEICKLACLEEIKIFDKSFNLDLNYFVAVNEYSKIYVITESLIDKDLELKKLNKELEDCKNKLVQAQNRLDNKEFMSKAPEKVVQGARDVVLKLESKIEKLVNSIEKLKK